MRINKNTNGADKVRAKRQKYSSVTKLICGLSEKADGSMRENSANRQGLANRKKFFRRLKIEPAKLIWAEGVPGDKIVLVNKNQSRQIIKGADGLISRDKNVFLALTVADCLPIYFYDLRQGVIGLAHAGWRGVLKNIAGKTARTMIDKFHCLAQNMNIYIGPHVKKCHFEVKADVAGKFYEYKEFVLKNKNKLWIDLSGIARKQLIDAGVKPINIKISPRCTFCDPNLFSWRRDQPEDLEAMVAFIGIK